MQYQGYRKGLITLITGAMCIVAINATPIRAQEADKPKPAETEKVKAIIPPADPKKALTTKDPTIPVADLELMLKPLTLEELQNEAGAWMILVKQKAQEISKAEIAVNHQNVSIDKQKEATKAIEAAQKGLTEAEKAQSTAVQGSPEYQAAAKKIEQAKANLSKAQEAVKESVKAKENIKKDKTLDKALQDAKKHNEIEEAKKVLEKAQKDRDKLTAGSAEYETATKKIDTLDKAIKALSEAQKNQNKTVPNSPEYKQAEEKLEAARKALLEARSAIDGKDTSSTDKQEQSAAEDAKKTGTELEKTEISITPDSKVAQLGETGATIEPIGEKQEKLDNHINNLEQSKEVDKDLKKQLLVNVSKLQSEQTALIDRLNAVLNEITNKGGEAEPYRKYIQAITTVKIDTKNTQDSYVRIVAWFKSEEGGLRWARNIGKFFSIIISTAIASQILSAILNLGLKKFGGISSLLRQFITILINRGGIIVGVLLALTALEVSLAPILAVVGGASFVLAFALQSNLGNFASGLMILVYKPFDVGDEVMIGHVSGWIESINLASTKIKGWQAQIYTLPNNTVWTSTIENFTWQKNRRGVITVGVTYETELRQVQEILVELAKAHPLILDEPEPMAFLSTYNDYTIDFSFGFWTKKDDFWNVWQDLHFQIMETFAAKGIDIPRPHQHIHLHQPENGHISNDQIVANLNETLKEEVASLPPSKAIQSPKGV